MKTGIRDRTCGDLIFAALTIGVVVGFSPATTADVPSQCVSALMQTDRGWDVLPTGIEDTECLQYALDHTQSGGVVLLAPGVYSTGPIAIERAHATLRGDTEPLFDADGYLSGFMSPVVLELNQDFLPPQFEADFVAVRADHTTLENVEIALGMRFANFFNSAVSVKAEGDDHYIGVALRNIRITTERDADTGIWTRNADVTISNILIDDGPDARHFVGINPTGNGSVMVDNVLVTNALLANVLFLGRWELPLPDAPSHLIGTITNSKLTDSGFGLAIMARGRFTQPDASSTLIVNASNLTLQGNYTGIEIWPHAYALAESTPTLINLDTSNDMFVDNVIEAGVSFQDLGGSQFIEQATVNVHDGDGVFPNPSEVDVGEAQLNNKYRLN